MTKLEHVYTETGEKLYTIRQLAAHVGRDRWTINRQYLKHAEGHVYYFNSKDTLLITEEGRRKILDYLSASKYLRKPLKNT